MDAVNSMPAGQATACARDADVYVLREMLVALGNATARDISPKLRGTLVGCAALVKAHVQESWR